MKSRLTLTRKIVLGVVVVTLAAVSTAGATDKFTDVPDAKFYHGPVGWAADNMITTGTSPTTFEPERGVTRGESVTFLKRYDDNVVQPALTDRYTKAEVDAAVAGATLAVYHASVNADGTTRDGTTAGVSVTHVAASGIYEIEFPPDDIRGCIFQATLVGEPFGLVFAGPPLPDGQITVAEDWDFGGLFFSADADSLVVATDDSGGAALDNPFHVSVFC